MVVYVLLYGDSYDGFDIMGIYTTEERAKSEKAFHEKERTLLDWRIDEFKLDENSY